MNQSDALKLEEIGRALYAEIKKSDKNKCIRGVQMKYNEIRCGCLKTENEM